jgi:hypothetical protein
VASGIRCSLTCATMKYAISTPSALEVDVTQRVQIRFPVGLAVEEALAFLSRGEGC